MEIEDNKKPEDKRKRSKSKHRRKKKDKEASEFDTIEGVRKVTLCPNTQHILGCIVGELVNGEDPWMFISKGSFEDALESKEGASDLQSCKQELLNFDSKKILVYYIADESSEKDEFYICVNKQAQVIIMELMERMKIDHEDRMMSILEKYPKPWSSLGSEEEVDDELLQRNRGLLLVEIETKYPIISNKVQFKINSVNDLKYGFVELLPERHPINAVYRRKIETYVQASPLCNAREVQTDCTYPKNAWTQYKYEYEIDEDPPEEFKESITSFINNQMERFDDHFYITANINLYSEDYENLVKNSEYIRPATVAAIREYTSFLDTKICKDKVISAVSWHPLYTGVFAVAYCDFTSNNFIYGDEPYDESRRIIHNTNPVLVWSFIDPLKPKLILEAYSEISTISFCPHDATLIIGGCRNGQVIIWDIRNKLQTVEDEDLLNPTQQKYRKLMYSHMGWVKNIKNIIIVPPAAISDLKHSHKNAVTQIEWMSPFHEISDAGIIKEIPEGCETFTLQFISCSMDGHILFWDLKSQSLSNIDEVFPERAERRLKKRPKALNSDISLYNALDGILKPMFKVEVADTVSMPITCLAMPHYQLEYEEMNPNTRKKFSIITKYLYRPILKKKTREIPQTFCLGTTEGQFITGGWTGYDAEFLDEQHIKDHDTSKLINITKYHDGPICSLCRWSEMPEVLLSVGGKIFCVWKEEMWEKISDKTSDKFSDRPISSDKSIYSEKPMSADRPASSDKKMLIYKPILWRRSRVRYTNGVWNSKKSTFKLTRADGTLETWSLVFKSKEPMQEQTISGKILTGTYLQRTNTEILGVADYNGSFRMFKALHSDNTSPQDLQTWLHKQVEIQNTFTKWQTAWSDRYAELLRPAREEAARQKKLKEDQDRIERIRFREQQERLAKEEQRLAIQRAKPPAGKKAEWLQSKWTVKEKTRLNRVILKLKDLKPDLLKEQELPLKQAEEAEKAKRKKKIAKHAEASQIFQKNVAMNFPLAIAQKPPLRRDPYAGGHSTEEKEEVMRNYEEQTSKIATYISDHPFKYEFNWHKIIGGGKERRKALDIPYGVSVHKNRHVQRVIEREKDAERVAEVKRLAAKAALKRVGRSRANIIKDVASVAASATSASKT